MTTKNVLPIEEKHIAGFWNKVEAGNGCWLWKGAMQHEYGQYKGRRAHRVAFVAVFGQIPEGFMIDHMCQNKRCVNPYHLDIVTNRQNVMRSPITQGSINVKKTHCPRGHEYNDINIRVYHGRKYCRVCDCLRKKPL